jgi:O-acetyl-ADP-ribose deacetylase (regulator of RNase III)
VPTRIRIEEGDLTDAAVDAIVNAANTDLVLGGGVAGAIRQKGGASVQEECERHGPIGLGEVALTGAGKLPARCVIHAAVLRLGEPPTEESIRGAARGALALARGRGLRSIAFPALGTGVGGFSVRRCAEVLLEEAERHVAEGTSLEEVRFVLFGEPAYRVFEQVRDAARIRASLERLRR